MSAANGSSGDEERVIVVDEEDRAIGDVEKIAAHRGEGTLHRAFSIFIFDERGRTLLQRRAESKYHFGGLWTNACCGHPRPDESVVQAGTRRLREEMGITADLRPVASFRYSARDPESGLVEREIDHVLVGAFSGAPSPDPDEASEWRWIAPDSLIQELQRSPEAYTPWLPHAWEALRAAEHAGGGSA